MKFSKFFSKKSQSVEEVQQTASSNSATSESSTNTENNSKSIRKKVYNLIILDESGSMGCIYQSALTGVNETLQTIRQTEDEHPDQEHFVTLVAFDTGHYNEIYRVTAAANAVDINENQYRPSGGTPLYDAMGRAINDLDKTAKEGDVVLVTIITDGYENASREYNGEAIKRLVEKMKEKGWVFTYIGANQDVEKVAMSMSIDNHLSYDSNEEGTQAMFAKELRSRKAFFDKVSLSEDCHDLSANYFHPDE